MLESIHQKLVSAFPEMELVELENTTPSGFEIASKDLLKISEYLRDTEGLFFDLLSCVTAVDNGPELGSIEIFYQLYSITTDQSLTLKTTIDRKQPQVDSVASIWSAANWHEREAFDLFGIDFIGHPDLRRILLPTDWEGHPLRKDYEAQEKYHGITVVYDRDGTVDND